MAQSPANPWIIRITLLVHFVVVCLGGLCYRGYLPEPQNALPIFLEIPVFVGSLLILFLCPLTILVLAITRPGRATGYAIVAEILLIYASAIALLPAVQ